MIFFIATSRSRLILDVAVDRLTVPFLITVFALIVGYAIARAYD